MITKLALWFIARRKRKTIKKLRRMLEKRGYNLSGFTDEQLEVGLRAISGNLSHYDFSYAELHQTMRAVAVSIK